MSICHKYSGREASSLTRPADRVSFVHLTRDQSTPAFALNRYVEPVEWTIARLWYIRNAAAELASVVISCASYLRQLFLIQDDFKLMIAISPHFTKTVLLVQLLGRNLYNRCVQM